ncbi:MAG: type III-B CRISPR module-associated protein Cmr5 [Verrucomicrobiota bacterium]
MRTLAQIRAANALADSRIKGMGHGQQGGDALSGFAMLIKTNGLLAAAAFAVETKQNGDLKHPGHKLIVDGIARHLSDRSISICEAKNAGDLVDQLSGGDVNSLTRATAEAVAYLNYLKRFVA